jgi:hypothetical protein
MSNHLVPVIAACASWLERAYARRDISALLSAMAEVQTRQAVTVAAWLRYPTAMDAALLHLTGPGGADALDAQLALPARPADPWRSWVDGAVVSWAACLFADPVLAGRAVVAAGRTEHARGLCLDFRRLLDPEPDESRATSLLRHPDLIEPVARLHRADLHAALAVAERPDE